MKKIVIFIIIAAFWAVSANAQVDLQITSVMTYQDQVMVVVQNNGTEDFQGGFFLSVNSDNYTDNLWYSAPIKACSKETFSYVEAAASDNYYFFLDAKSAVQETDESNNGYSYRRGNPQIELINNFGLSMESLYDTVYLLPGENYFEAINLTGLDSKFEPSIIGLTAKIMHNIIWAGQYFSTWTDGYASPLDYLNGKYFLKRNEYLVQIQWLANSSADATSYFNIGTVGFFNKMPVGQSTWLYCSATVATKNLSQVPVGFWRKIKVIDRIRGDVNDDGVVDEQDLNILVDVVNNNYFGLSAPANVLYRKAGLNYAAGSVLFGNPDVISNTLINIWLNNPNDLLVQGLGIGELMSKSLPGSEASAVKPIDNTFTVSENGKVVIDAPDADVYNVVAQDSEGKFVQRTGRLGEEISLPIDAKNIRVETVKIKNGTTGLFSATQTGPQISVYPNPVVDYLNINSPEAGRLSIMNLNGQEIYSQPINAQESLTLTTGDWNRGVYLIKIATATGQSTVKVVK